MLFQTTLWAGNDLFPVHAYTPTAVSGSHHPPGSDAIAYKNLAQLNHLVFKTSSRNTVRIGVHDPCGETLDAGSNIRKGLHEIKHTHCKAVRRLSHLTI
jgi:hypothetical protein